MRIEFCTHHKRGFERQTKEESVRVRERHREKITVKQLNELLYQNIVALLIGLLNRIIFKWQRCTLKMVII